MKFQAEYIRWNVNCVHCTGGHFKPKKARKNNLQNVISIILTNFSNVSNNFVVLQFKKKFSFHLNSLKSENQYFLAHFLFKRTHSALCTWTPVCFQGIMHDELIILRARKSYIINYFVNFKHQSIKQRLQLSRKFSYSTS